MSTHTPGLRPYITIEPTASGGYYAWVRPDDPGQAKVAVGIEHTAQQALDQACRLLLDRLPQFEAAWKRSFQMAALAARTKEEATRLLEDAQATIRKATGG